SSSAASPTPCGTSSLSRCDSASPPTASWAGSTAATASSPGAPDPWAPPPAASSANCLACPPCSPSPPRSSSPPSSAWPKSPTPPSAPPNTTLRTSTARRTSPTTAEGVLAGGRDTSRGSDDLMQPTVQNVRTVRALRSSGRRRCSRAGVPRRFGEWAAADADGQQIDDDPELAHGRGICEGVSDDLCLGSEISDERAEHVADAAADEPPAERARHPP